MVMLLLEIDDLEQISARRGQEYADFVLREVASLINENIRNTDTPARVDATCFAVLLHECKLTDGRILAERLRAAGAGIGGFFTCTGYGTELAKKADGSLKETREINGRMHVYEEPIHGDLALIKAECGDRWGNLTYRKAARNFGPVMATAAKKTVATVHRIVELGQMDPETIVTPGIFVSKIVQIPRVATQAGGFKS